MGDDLFKWKTSKNCASLVLNSLVEVGTIRKEKKLFGFSVRYPTADPGKFVLTFYGVLLKGCCMLPIFHIFVS